MTCLYFILLFTTYSFSQIQYGGQPSYSLENHKINFVSIDKSNIINNELHPMVLKYADEYKVDINLIDDANKITKKA